MHPFFFGGGGVIFHIPVPLILCAFFPCAREIVIASLRIMFRVAAPLPANFYVNPLRFFRVRLFQPSMILTGFIELFRFSVFHSYVSILFYLSFIVGWMKQRPKCFIFRSVQFIVWKYRIRLLQYVLQMLFIWYYYRVPEIS